MLDSEVRIHYQLFVGVQILEAKSLYGEEGTDPRVKDPSYYALLLSPAFAHLYQLRKTHDKQKVHFIPSFEHPIESLISHYFTFFYYKSRFLLQGTRGAIFFSL